MTMTLSLTLSPEVEARVFQEAARQSVAVEDYVASVVTAATPASADAERRARTLAALEAVAEMGSEEEQRETTGDCQGPTPPLSSAHGMSH